MNAFFSWIFRLARRARALAIFTVLAVMMAVVAPAALAEDLATPDLSNLPATSSGVGASIPQTIAVVAQTVVEAFEGLVKNEALQAGGKTITYTLFAIVFAWNLLRTMVQGEGVNGLVAELVPMIGTLAIIVALLDAGGVQKIIAFMGSVASTFGASGSLGQDVLAAIKKGMVAVANILSMPSTHTRVPLGFSSEALGAAMGVFAAFLMSLAAKLIAAFLVTIAVGIYVANVVLAHGSIMLAVALAPIMIPFLLAPALSFLFDGWLRFLLGATMVKVVGTFMIGFTDRLMDGLVALSEKVAVPPNADFTTILATAMVAYCGLVLLAGLCAYLMMMVPTLANGILSGSAGAGFKGMRAITGGVSFQAGTRAVGRANPSK